MDIAEITAQPRQARGSVACRRLRRQGLVPAVLYGHGGENIALSLDRREIEKQLAAHNLILNVRWDESSENVQVKELQYDNLGDHVIHVDLVRISMSEVITVAVPVEVQGEPRGVTDEGGVLETQMFEIEVECLPTAIPDAIRVDVAELGLHDALTVGDLAFPEGVRPTAEPETPVVVVTPPTQEIEEEAEVAEAAAEPEVIGRPAEEGEGETEAGE